MKPFKFYQDIPFSLKNGKRTGTSSGLPIGFHILVTFTFCLASWILLPTPLQSQSLLSDPDWLVRHNPPPSEEREIPPDNISGYDRQVIEELMGLKPASSEKVAPVLEKPGIRAPKLTADEARPRKILEPFLLGNPSAENIPEIELNFPTGSTLFEDSPGILMPRDFSERGDNSSDQLSLESSEKNKSNASIESVQSYLLEDPLQAKIDFEQIEHQLLLEDRARLKIQLLYHLDRLQAAEEMCRAFLQELSSSLWVPEIYYYLQLSLQGQQKRLERNAKLENLSLSNLKPDQLSHLLMLLSEDAIQQGNITTALRYRLEELNNPLTSSNADEEVIRELLRQMESVEGLRNLFQTYADLELVQEWFPSRLLEMLVAEQRFREASGQLDLMLEDARSLNEAEKTENLKNLRRRLSVTLNVNPLRIGVILPLSSNHPRISQLVQQTLEGLRLGLYPRPVLEEEGKLSKNNHPLQDIELVLRDSKLNPQTTRRVFRELVEEERVIAVIGPLARKTSEAAAEEAEFWQVPMISLSLTSSIPETGPFVFRNNQNWELEVDSLVRYAKEYYQARRFVILYIQNREGHEKARLFQKSVLAYGGKIEAIVGFQREQKSFVQQFDAFSGKLRSMTPDEAADLEELGEKEDPVLNFDAVFVAIGSGGMKDLQVIFPYASVYQMQKTLFLGDSGWNHPALPFVPRYQAFRKLVFTDGYTRLQSGVEREYFFKLHEKEMFRHQNYTRPSSYSAYAFDTLSMIKSLLKEEANHSHGDLKQALLNIRGFPGVTGTLSFDEKGEIQRNMQLLTLQRGNIASIE